MHTTEPQVIAHRGASEYEPEHTFAAYDLALAQGADVLEVDVRITADDQPMVLHDATLERTAGDRRALSSLRRRELEALDPAVRPLHLGDVLGRYGDEARYLIDLKAPSDAVVGAVIGEVVASGLLGRVQIQAFGRRGLRRVRSAHELVSLAQLYLPHSPAGLIRRDLARVATVADAIGPEAGSVEPGLVAAAHDRGLRVQPYTVNDPVRISELLAMGVDGVITDAPDRARAAAGARKPHLVAV